MWKAILGLVVGVLVGILLSSPLYAGKKKERIARDDDMDGVVEASIALYEWRGAYIGEMIHICCGDALTHRVTFFVHQSSLLRAPVLTMRWEVDNKRTHLERMKKFGPGYWLPRDDEFGAEYQQRQGGRW